MVTVIEEDITEQLFQLMLRSNDYRSDNQDPWREEAVDFAQLALKVADAARAEIIALRTLLNAKPIQILGDPEPSPELMKQDLMDSYRMASELEDIESILNRGDDNALGTV